MLERGFQPDFEAGVAGEVQALDRGTTLASDGEGLRDLRSLLWSSIDNQESRDLDQIEYAERLPNGDIRVMVGIADVDAFVPKGSEIDRHAFENTTSVYTGVITYPMLPDELSYGLTSLLDDEDRRAIVIDMVVTDDGSIKDSDIYPATVRNHAKLAYDFVGKWLESGRRPPGKISSIDGLEQQLLLQDEARQRLEALRESFGTLRLQTIEARTVASDGQVIDLELVEENPARGLIEHLMIAANVEVSRFLESRGLPSLRRVVRTPERWDKIVELARSHGFDLPANADTRALARFLTERKREDPVRFPDLSLTVVKLLGNGEYTVQLPGHPDQGHFALALHDYTHATAPNRRYPDLVTQRLLKAVMAGQPPPYSVDELEAVASHCSEREDAAKSVERTMRKVAAAVLLSHRIGEKFDGIVTGVTNKGTFARLFRPPAEGRIVQGEQGLKVGDKVRLRLVSVDADQAWIDFARARH